MASKSVRFDTEKNTVTHVPHVKDLSPEERSLIWIQKSDYDDMNKTLTSVRAKMNMNMHVLSWKHLIPSPDGCSRGLEQWIATEKARKTRAKAIQNVIQAVLKEQKRRRYQACCEERLANVYRSKSQSFIQNALHIGRKDELDVKQQQEPDLSVSSTMSASDSTASDPTQSSSVEAVGNDRPTKSRKDPFSEALTGFLKRRSC